MTESSSTTPTVDQIVTVSQADYKRFLQFQATDTTTIASHASTSGARDLFTCLLNLSNIHSVAITDGHPCSISDKGVVQVTSQITLDKVLFVPDFPVNLLSINAITKLLCYATFFPFHCTFQDLQTEKRIDLSRERGQGVYTSVSDEIPRGLALLASTSEFSFL